MTDALRNISPFDEVCLEIDDLYDEVANFADGAPIECQEQCDALDKLDKALLDADKRREVIRKEEARPFDEGKAAVQAKHNPVKDKVARARDVISKPRAAWKARVAAEKEAAAAAAAREADEKRRAAEEAIRASSGNLEAREEAEMQLAEAKVAEKVAKRADKAATTGTGLRPYWYPELADFDAAARHYWARDRAAFEHLVIDLARRDVQAGKRDIPGIRVVKEMRPV